ncbi:MAG: hypothetical protein GKR94_12745 [Gammaproteobacteria bacterium]|nr:hypothetical protein [Gammaproteobacteria bacterium]
MSLTTELLDTVRKLGALEARTEDVAKAQARIESKLNDFIDRLARIEANYEHLRESVKNEILADIKADLRGLQVYLDLEKRNLLPASDGEHGTSPPTA